jgi:alanyl-tRNA synthetase
MPTTSSLRTAAELRRAFLDFFKRHGHVEVPSSPLVPSDPTMLFTTAGMVQFKPYYTAAGDVPYTRAVSVQKCLRLTDLENVGLTPRHDTFFEMLGNFSFGPREKGAYFKAEAIEFAWEFVTKTLGLPKERLYASIFEGEGKLPRDDEAAELWKKMGLSADRIVPLGRKDNFWGPAGGAGACGPCSEIYFDLGEKRPEYLPADAFWGERPGDPGDRYMEFWNLVFPQFDAAPDGTLTPLARPGIDTGMGIERLALIIQGKNTIFETDVFEPMVRAVQEMGTAKPRDAKAALRDARIIADHVRALTFAIAEGALPGNEGAGYVLRRVLRRAVTRGRSRQGLDIHRTFLSRVAELTIDIFGGHYRDVADRRTQILKVLDQEEAGFAETYEAGIARLEKLLESGSQRIDGRDAFELHDTYGFPIELTEEIAATRSLTVDREGFERAMGEQRERARAASKFGRTGEVRPWTTVSSGADSVFLGWTSTRAEGLTIRRWRESDQGTFEVVLDRTPVYAESGGQVADRGTLEAGGVVADLVHAYKDGESIVHRVKMASGSRDAFLAAGAKSDVVADIPAAHRLPTMRHHTATHLLHAALRTVLGDHVHQAGSLVAPDRLRFDYSHFEAPSREQLDRIESRVAEWVLRDREVRWEILPLEQARAKGAMALFGEKYGAEVRVVTVDGVGDAAIEPSLELCGGTHVSRTGEIGAFAIVDESAIASGVRRVEALCGHHALAHFKAQGETLARAAAALQASPAQLVDQIEKQKVELERLRKEQAELKRGGLESEMTNLVSSAQSVPGGRWVVAELQAEADANAARDAADRLRGALGRGAAVLAIRNQGKITFLAAVSDDLVAEKKVNASDLVKKVAQVTGGSGGGKPHLALAGAKDQAKVAEALDEARRLLAEALGS